MAVDSKEKRWSMLGFGDTSHIPLPDGEIDPGDRLTLLGLYRGIAAALPVIPRLIGKAHKKIQRLTAPMMDLERVRLDRLAATEAKEQAMLTARIGVERGNLRTIVASMATAEGQRQRHLQMQIAQIEMRIKDLQMHLAKLKGGLQQ